MDNDHIYDDVCASLVKYCTDKIAVLTADFPTLVYQDWDAVAETQELPDSDLLGPAGLGLIEKEANLWEIVASVGVASCNDENLFRLRAMASKVFADFRPLKRLAIYRHSDAAPIGWAVVQGPVILTPISKQATRPIQFVQCQMLLDPMAPLR